MGIVFFLTGLLFAPPALLVIRAEGPSWGLGMVALLGSTMLAYGVWWLCVAVMRPVAVRMDADGISGFFLVSLKWSEIARMGVFKGDKGLRMLGIAVRDPVALHAAQTPWHRLLSHFRRKNAGYELVLVERGMHGADVDAMLASAQDLAAAAGTPLPHADVT